MFKAHRMLYHSTLGLRVKKKKKKDQAGRRQTARQPVSHCTTLGRWRQRDCTGWGVARNQGIGCDAEGLRPGETSDGKPRLRIAERIY